MLCVLYGCLYAYGPNNMLWAAMRGRVHGYMAREATPNCSPLEFSLRALPRARGSASIRQIFSLLPSRSCKSSPFCCIYGGTGQTTVQAGVIAVRVRERRRRAAAAGRATRVWVHGRRGVRRRGGECVCVRRRLRVVGGRGEEGLRFTNKLWYVL